MWVMAWVLMDGVRHVTLLQLLTEVRGWLFFTIRGAPPVNGMGDANQLMAGVTWSLPYEWWFYASLPAIGLLFGRRAPLGWLVFGVFNVLLFKAGWRLDSERLMPFIGGVLAAFAVRSEGLCRWARHPASGLAVLACLALTVAATRTAYEGTAVALLSGAFVLIACGSDVFGLFSAGASRMLGEATYSLYLLHGLMLSLVFRFFVGMPEAARWTPTQHWAVVLGLTVPLVGVSFLTYAWIEAPAQRSTSAVWARLQRRSTGAPAATSPL
jgi:peptidoglycan/LPS O-acetylase OafA/YrhL